MYNSTALQQYYSTKETIIICYLIYLFIYLLNPSNLRLRIWIVLVSVFCWIFPKKKTWASFAHVGTQWKMISEYKKNENLKNQWNWLR